MNHGSVYTAVQTRNNLFDRRRSGGTGRGRSISAAEHGQLVLPSMPLNVKQ